ncbi:light-regulated signal transduction histidine kinase (bacteriophytochrome)/CheY-like chemotaxis protein [Novosphingobium chloroacetimidivorans]|uniref:histidine kinase n=1 Tax=Novosphingobium chloroacetimidivorans TaxID=1428314 RepID=A0A7W7KCL1_9SPHN|nr:HWE histidine kinase domain-containing protein [Novosphingobium chloroacetimidivorans]MBB4859981.1 light-regulated signal transduction histidine kinase (bacteriophytochrome)/CheY-like chemotaxis protein [Novosphingobium chloroacetimidivorans]
MADMGHQVDLSTCDLEPIHIIGRIQSFGWLISFSHDWIINHVSLNVAEIFGTKPDDMIGRAATDFIAPDALHDIRTRLQILGTADAVERMFNIDLIQGSRSFDVALHASGQSFVLEIEETEAGRRRDYVNYVRPMIDRLRKSATTEQLCASAARHLRGLTAFDRVMIYRFEGSGAGEVIAESLNGSVDSFRGLHFPASDIPAQARRLYARNILRIISDVDDPTVPIIPATNPNGDPLDLSMSGLRAVSPIHIEYLRNMGVKASMSVSIMRRGKLWGLMACHHYAPLRLSYSVRTAAELFGEFFSYLLDQKESDTALEKRGASMRLHDEIMARVAGGDTLLNAFEDFAESIGKVIPFDGVVGWVDGQFMARGATPTEAEFAGLARFLNTAGARTVWSNDNLARVYEPAKAFADRVAGILALPVSRTPRDYIALFRKEQLKEVSWAGNPEKTIELGPNGPRLTPRKSFELWKEERRGFARAWTPDEIAAAESLRITLLEVVLRLADSAHLEREQANKQQDMLIAELNHRVRNILNLIRGLVTQSKEGAETIDQFAEIIGSRIHALARAHDQVTQTDWSPSSLYNLIRTEAAAYASDSADRVRIDGPDAMIAPAAFTTLALVIHEMMTNSCKYGALSDTPGRVVITISPGDDRSLEIDWHEMDGPPVEAPTRRGFGSTIIERTIPHELGGAATVDYPPEGLRAVFLIPTEHIATYDTPMPSPDEPPATTGDVRESAPELFSACALIVEDNVIIAMEAEDVLRTLGFQDCQIVGSVHAALTLLDTATVSFAMLDVNLGKETSEEVAAVLHQRGVPFIFASGYGDRSLATSRFEGVPVITKPYTERDIRSAIARLQAH